MPSKKCIHNKKIIYCTKCGGSGLCIHKKQKSHCKECNGSSICIHNKIRSYCKNCRGGSICEHNRYRTRCKECLGGSICEHNIQKYNCKECKGGSICEHNRKRSRCKQCKGGSICEHNKERYNCRECNGKGICEHKRERTNCKECKGSSICEHNKQKKFCIICTPSSGCQNCKYTLIRKNSYYPYCFSCFCVLNPDVEIPKRYKIKENYLRDRLKDEYKETVTITFDKKVEDGCSKRRPDVRIDFGTHNIIVECDENEHRGYSCDNKRTMEIFQDCGNRPIVFLRFNPDSYEENYIRYKGCFSPTKNGLQVDEKEFERRVKILIERIDFYMKNVPLKEVTIENFFYSDVLYIPSHSSNCNVKIDDNGEYMGCTCV